MWLPGQRAARLALELAWGAACGFALLYHKKEAEKERSKFPTAFPRLPPPVTAMLEIGVRSGGVWKVGVTGTLKLSGKWN